MAANKLFYIAAKAFITNERGEILLLYVGQPRNAIKTNYWDLPGGRIQEGQSALATLQNELKEELGWPELLPADFKAAVISNHDAMIEGHERGLAILIYDVNMPANFGITLSNEHTKYEWVDSRTAAARLSPKYPPEFTESVLKH